MLSTDFTYPRRRRKITTGFKVRLFEDEKFENCKLIVSLVETGNLALNSLMELILLQKAEYIGYALSHDKLTLAKMVEGMPGSTLPLYRKDNIVYLPSSTPVTTNLSNQFSSSLIDWIVESKFSELIILGSLRMFQVETKQLRFYSKKYIEQRNKKMKHVQNGLAIGGTGPQLFIKSDFNDMLSQAIFMVTGEPEDDVLLIPDTMRELLDILELDVDLKKWQVEFNKELDSLDNDVEEHVEIPTRSTDYI